VSSPVRPTLSIVLPVYNEEAVIPELLRRLELFLNGVGVGWEVVFVDDGSSDASPALIEHACEREPRYRLISLSRNFGHQVAITAGMDHAAGDAVVVMDADLQDPPEVVGEMLARYRAGYDVVHGVRRTRAGETLFKRATAALWYRMMRKVAGIDVPLDAGDFRLMSRRVVVALRSLREANRFVRGLVVWVGFKQTTVEYDRPARFAGETHYSLRRMLRFAADAVLSLSLLPLRAATVLGFVLGLCALGVLTWLAYSELTSIRPVPAWAPFVGGIGLVVSVQLLMTGILGAYLGRIYDEVKRRPLYLIDRTRNMAERPALETDARNSSPRPIASGDESS
jgi:polyisoprenyl-phosphate glycosyltransferase